VEIKAVQSADPKIKNTKYTFLF